MEAHKSTASVHRAIHPSLTGRTVIVSGGGSGIGEAVAEACVRQGAAVAFVDIQESPSKNLIWRLVDAETPPHFIHCDITDCVDYGHKVSALIDSLDGCDVLINNAASDDGHPFDDVTPDYWDECMAVNFEHKIFAPKAVVPAMRATGGGAIVNMGSISSHLGLKDLVIYQTAEAAIEGMTSSLAREPVRDNIRVNTVIPGNVQTPRQLKWHSSGAEREVVSYQTLDGRIQPMDFGAMALFLASDDARYCSAHNYWVDAG